MYKRIFDIVLSALLLVGLFPVLVIAAVAIKMNSLGPIVFIQKRVGLHDKEFLMYKFRTMHLGTPEVATAALASPQDYITTVGYYLRKYSIDELPQLGNILLGDMGIVGPRPALYNQYDLRELRRKSGVCTMRPGLTGWAQINGRDEISVEEKVNLDKYYCEHQSLLFDVKIILRTAQGVSAGSGVAQYRAEMGKERTRI